MPPAPQRSDLHIPRLGAAPERTGAVHTVAPLNPKTDAPSVLPWLAKRIAFLVLGILVLALTFGVFKNAFTGFLLLVFPFCCVGWVLNTGSKLFGWNQNNGSSDNPAILYLRESWDRERLQQAVCAAEIKQ